MPTYTNYDKECLDRYGARTCIFIETKKDKFEVRLMDEISKQHQSMYVQRNYLYEAVPRMLTNKYTVVIIEQFVDTQEITAQHKEFKDLSFLWTNCGDCLKKTPEPGCYFTCTLTCKMMLSDEYFEHWEKYTAEYGEKTTVLMQDGAFYEILMIENDKEKIGTNLHDISEVLNIAITRKNKSLSFIDRSNPAFAGFPLTSLPKFLPVLLENGYTVVIVEEAENTSSKKNCKKTRCVKGVYSPSMQPIDMLVTNVGRQSDGDSVTTITIEVLSSGLNVSLCNMNMTTNCMEVYENSYGHDVQFVLDEVHKGLLRYNSKEILVCIVNIVSHSHKTITKEYVENYLNVYDKALHYREIDRGMFAEYSKLSYQDKFFRKIYKHIDFGMLSPIEYFGLEKHQLSTLTVIKLLEFISRHDIKYVQNIAQPKLLCESDHLVLELNTLQQLAVVGTQPYSKCKYGSLYDVVNKTKTSIGRRGLRKVLCKPFKTYGEIQRRYEFMDALDENKSVLTEIRQLLDGTCDVERLHRKLGLGSLHPFELYSLLTSYCRIVAMYDALASVSIDRRIAEFLVDGQIRIKLQEFVNKCNAMFDIEELKQNTMNETHTTIGMYFRTGSAVEVDDIYTKIREVEDAMERLRMYYEEKMTGTSAKTKGEQKPIDWIKRMYTDQDGYYFSCTKVRSQLLQKVLDKDELAEMSFKNNTSVCKISSVQMNIMSKRLVTLREEFCTKIKNSYINAIGRLYDEYNSLFDAAVSFIELIDLCQSNLRCKYEYNYCRPEVVDASDSFVEAYELRHPIIERINDNTEYVPNDIILNDTNKGMILYALNACGKSSLLRSIGLSVILAQSGMYVPCREFRFSPFDCMVSQVEMHDNMWKSQSSFVSEMVGLRRICGIANEKCLVLSDELTKGTEVVSATSIFAAAVLHLLKRGAKFVFTTHLQDVAKIESIKSHENLRICHLSVDIKNDTIVFCRKLEEGPCSELYGLEVARAVGLNMEMIDEAFSIREGLLGKRKCIVSTKRSRYNKKKILDDCEVCGYMPVARTDLPLDTHHIKFQCMADDNDFNKHFHKNSVHNLVSLCKNCHIRVHNGELVINGYVQGTNGVQLDYQVPQTQS